MEGAKAGVPKPELVHKLEGCTDEVTQRKSEKAKQKKRKKGYPALPPGERGGAGAGGAGGDLHLQRPQRQSLAP